MTVLAEKLRVTERFARSANLERDAALTEPLDGYIVTSRALDVVDRVTAAAADGTAGGAWSVTGPYGSGKSSLALLLDAAFGPAGAVRDVADTLISAASRAEGGGTSDFLRAHKRHGTTQRGFHRGLVTAQREPLGHTILRALHSAVQRGYDDPNSFGACDALAEALADAASNDPRRTGPAPATLLRIARCLAADAPLLLVVDEFGKSLESVGTGDDPYLLQQLAEEGQGAGLPIFLLTLQHLSFDDYMAGTAGPERQEWAKVRGRFEDVAFTDSPAQTRALVGTVFTVANEQLQQRVQRWARPLARQMRSLGIADLAEVETVAACYPLHPLAAAVLPELCSRYGQHERTLFSFLTSADPSSAATFLRDANLPSRGRLPCLGLDTVYDYFVASGLAGAPATASSRWVEVATRLRDAHGLSKRQERLAKSVALLNLVSASGTLRASQGVLAMLDPDVDVVLTELADMGLVTYRDFADEYRVWQGTDVDLGGLTEQARRRVGGQPLLETLRSVDQPEPQVAARHSAKHDTLRVFSRRYAGDSETVEMLDAFSPFDGEVLLMVGTDDSAPTVEDLPDGAKPVLAAIPTDITALGEAACEVAALRSVLDDPAVEQDWVARGELGERLAQAQQALQEAVAETFNPETCRWELLRGSQDGGEWEQIDGGRGSSPLSTAAERAYPSTPPVGNEVLNRSQLTSQGAKARRELIEAMITHGSEPGLAMSGHGPEVSIYRALLVGTGMHRVPSEGEPMCFARPTAASLQPAWDVLEAEFDRARDRRVKLTDAYAALQSPPIGMKAGAVPVLVTAALLAHAEQVAIYEHGTFVPVLTPEVSERMVRNPGHFDFKNFANATGGRKRLIETLRRRLGARPNADGLRVASVLSVVSRLLARVRKLDAFTLQTSLLSPRTLRVREVLATAVEPDELLFVSLPEALDLPAVGDGAKTYKQAAAYAAALAEVLDELTGRVDVLLGDLLEVLLDASVGASRDVVAAQAAALGDEVLDPEVRAFVLALANDGIESDEDWVKIIATVVARKAPTEWSDEDLQQTMQVLPQRVAAFERLVALHAEQTNTEDALLETLYVTVTRSDGSEQSRLVALGAKQRDRAETALEQAVKDLAGQMGSEQRAHRALLALICEQLLPEDDKETVEAEPIATEPRLMAGGSGHG